MYGGEEEFRMITAHWPEIEVHLDMIERYSVLMERCTIFDDNNGVSEKVCICYCRIEQGLESTDFRRIMEQVFSYGCDEEVVDRADFLAAALLAQTREKIFVWAPATTHTPWVGRVG